MCSPYFPESYRGEGPFKAQEAMSFLRWSLSQSAYMPGGRGSAPDITPGYGRVAGNQVTSCRRTSAGGCDRWILTASQNGSSRQWLTVKSRDPCPGSAGLGPFRRRIPVLPGR